MIEIDLGKKGFVWPIGYSASSALEWKFTGMDTWTLILASVYDFCELKQLLKLPDLVINLWDRTLQLDILQSSMKSLLVLQTKHRKQISKLFFYCYFYQVFFISELKNQMLYSEYLLD